MHSEEFIKISDKLINECFDLLRVSKAREYSRDNDRLSNFKRAAIIMRTTPEETLKGFLTKHITSIYDMFDDLNKGLYPPLEQWKEKIMDIINYHILLWALLDEKYSIPDTEKENNK